MDNKKKLSNLINTKYKILLFIGVFLLAIFLVFTILKQLGLFAAEPIGFIDYPDLPTPIVKFCIEYVVNDTATTTVFVLRNCGGLDVSQNDFAATSYYVNGVKTACTPDGITDFEVYSLKTIKCSVITSCEAGKDCTRTINVVPMKGEGAVVAYQYVPK